MSQLQKYREFLSILNSPSTETNHEHLSQFYFHQLKRLEIDLLLADIEVTEQNRQINAIQNKIGTVRLQQRNSDNQNGRESSSEEVMGEFVCGVKECGKNFDKESGLKLHTQLLHGSNENFHKNMLFALSIEQQI